MARFDVHRMPDGYALDCQADGLSHFNTRFAIPLWAPENAPTAAGRLNPTFHVEGRSVVMVTQFAAALPVRALGERVTSLIEHDIAIINAIDMLTTGY